MAYEILGKGSLDYQPCRYGTSKFLFRGPKKKLSAPYVAVLGGTETYGKFIEQPYPELLQLELGTQAVNLGCPNAGVDAYLNDHGVLTISNKAKMTVLQVPGAHNMSNRFYAVHPRRNDRFLRASGLLKDLYREIDFTEFNFTRHLLSVLYETSTERFTKVEEELRTAWVSRMKLLIANLDCKIVLLWLADHPITQGGQQGIHGTDPLFVTADMISELRTFVCDLVEVVATEQDREQGRHGLVFADTDEPATREMLGSIAHRKASRLLQESIEKALC